MIKRYHLYRVLQYDLDSSSCADRCVRSGCSAKTPRSITATSSSISPATSGSRASRQTPSRASSAIAASPESSAPRAAAMDVRLFRHQ
jgi:hypothetical protein